MSAPQKPYPVVTEIKDGVKTLVNPDFPRDGRWKAKLVEEMSCGISGSQEGLLHRPMELKVDGQGRIYVMDWGGSCIRVYDDRGKFLRKIGRAGQGPGELGSLTFFELLSKDRICILDGGQRRVMIMTTEGQYVSGFPLEGTFIGLGIDDQENFYLGRSGPVEEPKLTTENQVVPYMTSIFRTEIVGNRLVHLTDILGEYVLMKSLEKGTLTSWAGGGTLGSTAWNVDGGGRIYGGFTGNYRLTAFDWEGKVRFIFGREFEHLKNPYFRGTTGQRKTLPAFTRNIVFDSDCNIWIELYPKDGAKDYLYDVFSPDGIYLKQVRIATRISQFMKGKLYSLIRSDDEEPAVKRFSMELVSD